MTLADILKTHDSLPLLALRMLRLKRRVVRLLMDGERTILELGRITEFSIPTVTKIMGELMEAGVARECGKLDTSGGRRPVVYALNPDCAFLLGVDVKRDSANLALLDMKGQTVAEQMGLPFTLADDIDSLCRLCDLINQFVDREPLWRERLLGACVVFPGRIDSERGINHTFYTFDGTPLSRLIEDRIGVPTRIENDSRAMLAGEQAARPDRPIRNGVFLNISWGFGISMICGGQLYYGQNGLSGEYGHSPILDNEILCECGKKGCIQTEISGQTLVRLFRQRMEEGAVSVLAGRLRPDQIGMHDIVQAAVREGDVLAIETLGRIGQSMGRYLSLLVNVFNPDTVIIGGDVAVAGTYLECPIRSSLHLYSLPLLWQHLDLRVAALGERGAVVGACHILAEALFPDENL